MPRQATIALFSRVLQNNSVCPFNTVFWLLIFTGRDTSWPPWLSCWPGEHWSHRRNFSGISFLFGGIYVPVSSSLYDKICITKKAFRGRGAEWRKVLWNQSCSQSFVCLVYYLVLSKYETGTDAPIHKELPARQPSGVPVELVWESILPRKSFILFFVKWSNAWNAFERITRENEGAIWSISVNSALPHES